MISRGRREETKNGVNPHHILDLRDLQMEIVLNLTTEKIILGIRLAEVEVPVEERVDLVHPGELADPVVVAIEDSFRILASPERGSCNNLGENIGR